MRARPTRQEMYDEERTMVKICVETVEVSQQIMAYRKPTSGEIAKLEAEEKELMESLGSARVILQ